MESIPTGHAIPLQGTRSLVITRRNGDKYTVYYDAEDAPLIESRRWHVQVLPTVVYARTRLNVEGRWRVVGMHAFLEGSGIDHINRNGLDNRRANLRRATGSQNCGNRGPRPGSSQYKGVSWNTKNQRWVAAVQSGDSKPEYLGSFTSETDAARAYDLAALRIWGEFAYLNFSQQSSIS